LYLLAGQFAIVPVSLLREREFSAILLKAADLLTEHRLFI
jgi:hypothetical protein